MKYEKKMKKWMKKYEKIWKKIKKKYDKLIKKKFLKYIMGLINQFMRKLVMIKQVSLILFLQVSYQKIIIIKSLEMLLKY